MVQLLCGWKAHVVVNVSICVYNLMLHFCAKEKKTHFSKRAVSSASFPLAWKERQLLGVAITDAPSEESWWKSALVLVANGSLPGVVTGELGSSTFGFQVDSKLSVVSDKVQGQHKVHLHGAFSLPAVMAQLCAPSLQQLA